MAKIRDLTVTEYASNTLTWAPEMPAHVSGDLLLVFIGKDGNTGFTGTPSGWTAEQTQASAGAYMAIYSKVAASAAETFSITLSTTDTGVIIVVAVKDVYSGGEVNVSGKLGSDDSTIPFAGVSGVSTSQDNCLVFHMCGGDSGLAPTAYAPLVNLYCGDATNGSLGLAYTFQKTAGAIPQVDWFGRGADDTRTMLIAVRSSGSGDRQGYSDPAVSSGQVLRPVVGLSTMFSDSWPVALTFGMLGNDWITAYKYNAPSTYTDILSAANDATTADVTFPTAVGDMIYLGADRKFDGCTVNISTAGAAGVLAWEYYNGSSWVSTGVTGSNLTATGVTRITLSPVAIAALSQTTVNSVSRYWLRARITTLYTTAIIMSQSRESGRVTAYIVSAASGDNGTNPYCDGASNAGSSSTANLAGFEHQFGASLDMDTGIIVSTFRGALARDLAVDQAKPFPFNKPGGCQVTFADASGYYASYTVSAKGALDTNVDGRNVFAIDWNGSAEAFGLRGSVSKSAVTRQLSTTYGYDGAVAIVWSMLSLVTRIGFAGGSSGTPLDFSEIADIANNCIGKFPFFQLAGDAALIYAPLQFGGSDPVYININLKTFQFPRRYDGVDYFSWNAADDVAGIKFYPVNSGDVLKFTNCIFTSPSRYRWEFDASASASATIDFAGSTVIGANVTLRDLNTAFDSMNFIDCPVFTQNGAEITNCAFDNTKISASSPANAAKIQDCTFISGGTGHAIEISGSAADFSLDGCQFSGYAASDGSSGNEAVYVNIASGTITISITGGGSTPSIRTAGATVTVQSAVTVKVTVKDVNTGAAIENARVLVEAAAGGDLSEGTDVLTGLTNSSGIIQTTSFNYTDDQPVTGKARRASSGYGTLYKTSPISATITSSGLDITVLLIPDE